MTEQTSPDFDLHPFFEHTPDLVCIAGKDGYFRKINHSVIEKLQFTKEELFASPIAAFIHPEDREKTARERARLLMGQPLTNFQNRYIAKDGKIVWLDWTSIYFADQEIVFAIAKEVTERKRVEEETAKKYTQYKSLATHFKASMETERKYLAGELHEEVAQLAAVVKMELNWISSNLPGLSGNIKTRFDNALSMADLLISVIQRISFSISPAMLDDLGLDAALGWLCQEFGVLNGIPCRFESAYDEERLSSEIGLDFFRICQESMRNIMLHDPASAILIRIDQQTHLICLSITYERTGPATLLQPHNDMWKGIQERAFSFNCELEMEHIHPLQTCLIVRVPA